VTDKRTLILQTTRGLLNDYDYTQITISQIAKACGIGKGTVYEYFQSKEDLFIQVIVSYTEEQNRVLCQPLEAVSLAQAIYNIVLRLYDMFERNSAMPSLFLGILQQQGLPAEILNKVCHLLTPLCNSFISYIRRLCQKAVARGELRCLPDEFALSYISLGLASYIAMKHHSDLPKEQLAEKCTQMVLRQLPLAKEPSHA